MSPGTPVSYQALTKGTPVCDETAAKFGTVEHVLQIPELDLFDGLVVKTRDGLRFVDRDEIITITTSEVTCKLSAQQVQDLPQPAGDEVYRADPDQDAGDDFTAHLGRLFRRAHWVKE